MKKWLSALVLVLFAFLPACSQAASVDGTVEVKGKDGKTYTFRLVEIGKTDGGKTCIYIRGSEKSDICSYEMSGTGFKWNIRADATILCGSKEYKSIKSVPYLSSRPGNALCLVFDTDEAPDKIKVYNKVNESGGVTLTVSALKLDPGLTVSDKAAKTLPPTAAPTPTPKAAKTAAPTPSPSPTPSLAATAGEEGTLIPKELVGTWTGSGKPVGGGSPISLDIVVNADATGVYTFEQSGYEESYPFVLSSDSGSFSVDIPADNQLGISACGGSYSYSDGVLTLNITTKFSSGRQFKYVAECTKVN